MSFFNRVTLSLLLFHWVLGFTLCSASAEELTDIPIRFLSFAKKDDFFDWMVGVRRKIHENPELGYGEFETSTLINA